MQRVTRLFVGIGSPHGDDQIGWLIADALSVRQLQFDFRKAKTPGELLDWLDSVDELVICDACTNTTSLDADQFESGFVRWLWPTPDIQYVRSANSHTLGLPQVLQLAQQLGTLPATVVIYGVRASSFNAFAQLSPSLTQQLDSISDSIAQELVTIPTEDCGREVGDCA